ncbi:DUF4112 domain-containing protein [Phycisphaerales bacterium ac7]
MERAQHRADALAKFLDSRFRLPGTSVRFGWDAIVSVLPLAGDTIMLVIGLYPVYEALRLRLGIGVALRMLFNLLIDWLVGLFPVIGVVPDVWYKANVRNAALLAKAIARRSGQEA